MRTFPLLAGTLAVALGAPSAANGNDNEGGVSPLTLALSSDGVTAQVEGRVQFDFGVATGDAPYDLDDAVDFRRGYLGVGGTLYESIDYKASYDLAESSNSLTDVYLTINGTVAGDVTVGHFKEPFGLEELTSNKYLLFAERSVANALMPARNMGIMVSDQCANGQINWAIGLFRDTGSDGDDEDSSGSEMAVTARVTGTLWNDNGGTQALHLGIGLSQREADDDAVSFAAGPDVHFADDVIEVEYLSGMADSTTLAGLEVAWVDGPLTVQGEYVMASVSGENGAPDGDFNGMYVSGAYFLTGEARPYKSKGGVFGRVKPNENYKPGQGGGAWMVGARLGMLDLNDGPNTGVEDITNFTLGLTRILNPYTRIVGNLIQSTASMPGGASDADATIGVIRFQFDF